LAGSHEARVKPDCRSTKSFFRAGVTWTGLNSGACMVYSPQISQFIIFHQMNFFVHMPKLIWFLSYNVCLQY
jgi:hypothetical protein